MIRANPDLTLNPTRLESILHNLKIQIKSKKEWYFREKYVDNGPRDPHYIIDIIENIPNKGDDLLDEPLFNTQKPEYKIKHLTRSGSEKKYPYWVKVNNQLLSKRVDRFRKMYFEDYLQPPGYKGDDKKMKTPHDCMEKRRFLYRISLQNKKNVGIGSKMFAELSGGAIKGTLYTGQNSPANDVEIELKSLNGTWKTKSLANGFFCFSRVPAGKMSLSISSNDCHIKNQSFEPFGRIRGTIRGTEPKDEIRFVAPDKEIFRGHPNEQGSFEYYPMPALSYTLQVPGYTFSVSFHFEKDNSVLGGILKHISGRSMKNQEVLLKQGTSLIAKKNTGEMSEFRFDNLKAGTYSLEIPGFIIKEKKLSPSSISGKIKGLTQPITLKLICKDAVIAETKTTESFSFENLIPGKYAVSTSDCNLERK